MKVIGIVGSPREGNTEFMVKEAINGANNTGAETELILLRKLKIQMCDGCLECDKTGKCHFNDDMNAINEKLAKTDGLIIGTPSRWSLLSGNLKVFFDRTNPLAVPELLSGKKAGIIAVGQSPEEEEEKSIQKAANSIVQFCSNAGIDVVGTVLGFNAVNTKDIVKNKKSLKQCQELGIKLVKELSV